ncbi:MAG: helix-hairpin-helix domain-containing protein [Oscillospiraceae bacterium]|nr:helix-hairpin-helix domain-containing protein [Oscillospiraceae bacterium]
MENKNPNDHEDSDIKRIALFTLIAANVILVVFLFPEISYKYNNHSTTVYTLSREQVEELGFTTTVNVNTDIWETDDEETAVPVNNETFEMSESLTSEKMSVTVTFPIDINSASADELIMVKGIGKVTANNIIEYRDINGYFYSFDELLNVDGIGKSKLADLSGYIYIDYDSLPETLPYAPNYEYDTNVETTVPQTDTEFNIAFLVSAVASVTTEDFIMETEEFVTDIDEEFETEKSYSQLSGYNDLDFFKFTDTEPEYYPNFPIELNSADAKDLMYIKGIGESTANKIVEYARTVGFNSVDDLLNVGGIGQSKLEAIRPYVYVTSNGVDNTESETIWENSVTGDIPHDVYRVNINTCGKDDLLQLPGITEDLADEILELRSSIGYFQNIEELSFAISNDKLSMIWNYVYV